MDNNVILSVSLALVEKSIIAFMFNFRGVGGSQGSFGGGIAEQEDVAAAISWIVSQPEVDSNRVGLSGYSFGAAVALPVACADDRVKALALISMPPGQSQISQLKSCTKPKLIICGTNDFVVPLEQAQLMSREAAEPKQFELISGADHLWWGYESVLAEKVAAFFEDQIPNPKHQILNKSVKIQSYGLILGFGQLTVYYFALDFGYAVLGCGNQVRVIR